MTESSARRKRKRSITVEPSCIFDTSPTPSQRANNFSHLTDLSDTHTRSPSCPPIACIAPLASEEQHVGDDGKENDSSMVDELASPENPEPLTIEAFLQRSSAKAVRTYRRRRKRRRVHFADSDGVYVPQGDEDDSDDDEDPGHGQTDGSDELSAPLADGTFPAPPRPRKRSNITGFSRRLIAAALETGGTVPVGPDPPATPPRPPLSFVLASKSKPPKRPRKTGHLVDPRRRAAIGRLTSHFRSTSLAMSAPALATAGLRAPGGTCAPCSTGTIPAPHTCYDPAEPCKKAHKWKTRPPPILPKAYFTRAEEDAAPSNLKKSHKRQTNDSALDTAPLKLVPLEESIVRLHTRRGRRVLGKKGPAMVQVGPAPLTFVSVPTVAGAKKEKPSTGGKDVSVSSPVYSPSKPAFCMTSVRNRLLTAGMHTLAQTRSAFVVAVNHPQDLDESESFDALDSFNASDPFKTLGTSAAPNLPTPLLDTTASLLSSSKPALYSATNPAHSSSSKPALLSSTSKPLKPLAAFHDRLAETVRTATQLVYAAGAVLRTPASRRKIPSWVSLSLTSRFADLFASSLQNAIYASVNHSLSAYACNSLTTKLRRPLFFAISAPRF
ncbi:hypothetical protein HDZ31DRAFT_67934 [Schizophyllum fasciatum]